MDKLDGHQHLELNGPGMKRHHTLLVGGGQLCALLEVMLGDSDGVVEDKDELGEEGHHTVLEDGGFCGVVGSVGHVHGVAVDTGRD